MNKIKSFLSYIVPILLGGFLFSLMSAIQKMALSYPLYPVSFIVPFIAGSILGFLYHLRRKLEKKHNEKIELYNKKLETVLKRLETILETIQSGIIIIDAKTATIESINPTAQLLYGYSETEVVGKKCHDYLCDINPEDCSILKKDVDVDIVAQTEIKTTDFNTPIILKAKKVSFDDHMHIIVSMMDISPLVETEKQLREANERVRIADRLKTEFLTNVGHEIRTPLNAVIGMSELLMSQDFSDDTIESLELIKNSGKSLLNTMENIMDYATLKSGNYVLKNHTFDLHQVLSYVTDIYMNKAAVQELTFNLDIENCKGMQYVGDQSIFQKIISNLLDNAIKFTPSGSVTLKTSFISEPLMIDIQISDTGVGIPEHKQNFIFDAFYQVNGSRTRSYEGTGMGLALVDFYVQKMGASIKVDSSIDKGSTFHIYLPV